MFQIKDFSLVLLIFSFMFLLPLSTCELYVCSTKRRVDEGTESDQKVEEKQNYLNTDTK